MRCCADSRGSREGRALGSGTVPTATAHGPEVIGASGLRVLEVGHRLATASAGLVLVALGASVAQVRLGDRRVPAAEAAYYDRGRTRVEGAEPLSALGSLADVVVTDLTDQELATLGLPADAEHLGAGDRAQVLVTIRSLGRTGPNAGFRMTELTEWASGGLANVTRRPHPGDPERYVPVVPPGHQPQALAGLAAATGALTARRWATQRHQPVIVDVSVQEVMAATLHSIVPNFVWNGHVLGHPSTPNSAVGMLLPAVDGDVYIRTVEAHQWEKLMAWMGEPDWASTLAPDPESRLANADALRALVGEWTAPQRRSDLVAEGQRRKVPVALPRSVRDVLAWQHLRARGAWGTADLAGQTVEVPRLPMIEPPSWAPTRAAGAAAVAEQWAGA